MQSHFKLKEGGTAELFYVNLSVETIKLMHNRL